MYTLKLHLREKVYGLRHAALQAAGYKTVNPVCRGWEIFPTDRMAVALDYVLQEAKVKIPVDVAIDHGCWTGRYAKTLRRYTRRLVGVDILPYRHAMYQSYIRVPTDLQADYFSELADDSVDLVFVIASVGLTAGGQNDDAPHCGDWKDYISDSKGRQGRYFTPANYPRVIKPGGCIVIQEWEAYPERRVGKLAPDAVRARIDEFYPHADIPGFSVVAKGISPLRIGPYIVLRKLT